jgi:hypothetical protein
MGETENVSVCINFSNYISEHSPEKTGICNFGSLFCSQMKVVLGKLPFPFNLVLSQLYSHKNKTRWFPS